ncbi:MAG: hypothetical protein IIU11_09850 [Bacteroidales bacterium]|jgi:acid stress-induced BolA-like protein IbaG/YrbA|nr:hypothetical protein [Bacteroidales bacterium]
MKKIFMTLLFAAFLSVIGFAQTISVKHNVINNGVKSMQVNIEYHCTASIQIYTVLTIYDANGNVVRGDGEDGYMIYVGKSILKTFANQNQTTSHSISYAQLGKFLKKNTTYYVSMDIYDYQSNEMLIEGEPVDFYIY